MKDTLGGKGANLAEMTNAGLPVPPGFTISTDACRAYYAEGRKVPAAVETQMLENVKKLEKAVGNKLGDVKKPLLVSVRSGAKFSMPGMMDTILNLGLNDQTVESLKARTGNGRFAFDSYRRFIQMFGAVVLEIPKDAFEHEFEAVKHERGAKVDTDLDEAGLQETVARYKKVVKEKSGKPFPQDPQAQMRGARDAVFRSWNNPRAREYRRIYDIPDEIGTAVNIQAMVFGNTGDRSATGVGFTRNPATGANEFFGEFLVNAQGEDVVAGVRTPLPIAELEKVMPARLQGAAQDHQPPGEDLQGHPGLRVHDRGRQALHAADPERQAHRLRGGPHRHRLRRREAAEAARGAAPGRARGAVAAAGAGVRSGRVEEAAGRDQGPAGLAGRRVGPGGVHLRARRRARPTPARRSCWSARRRRRTTSTACSCRRASSPRPAA